MTQESLATVVRVSNTYIHQLETGKTDAPTREMCRKLAWALADTDESREHLFSELWDLASRERARKHLQKAGLEPAAAYQLAAQPQASTVASSPAGSGVPASVVGIDHLYELVRSGSQELLALPSMPEGLQEVLVEEGSSLKLDELEWLLNVIPKHEARDKQFYLFALSLYRNKSLVRRRGE